MTVIFARNTSLSTINVNDLGLKIPALSSIKISDLYKDFEIYNSKNLKDFIKTGDIVINIGDGTIAYDLSYGEALRYLSQPNFDSFFTNVLNIQYDSTLDPTASPDMLDRYLITNSGNLHANFGTIDGVVDNDIVEYVDTDNDDIADSFVVKRTPNRGNLIWVDSVSSFYKFNGSSWSEFVEGNGSSAVSGLVHSMLLMGG